MNLEIRTQERCIPMNPFAKSASYDPAILLASLSSRQNPETRRAAAMPLTERYVNSQSRPSPGSAYKRSQPLIRYVAGVYSLGDFVRDYTTPRRLPLTQQLDLVCSRFHRPIRMAGLNSVRSASSTEPA